MDNKVNKIALVTVQAAVLDMLRRRNWRLWDMILSLLLEGWID